MTLTFFFLYLPQVPLDHNCFNGLAVCFTPFLRAHEHIYVMECALSQNVLLPLLMVYFVSRMY